MRWTSHPGRALIVALIIAMIPGVVGAQQGTPIASPQAPEQAIWERLDGVQQVVVRTWGDVPAGTPEPDEMPTLRFVTGLVAEFEGEEQAASAVEPIRDWMLASLQVNLVDLDLTAQEVSVTDLGDNTSAVVATGTAGERPLTIAVVVTQQGNRVLAAGGSVNADQELVPILQDILTVMLDREPGGEEQRDNAGRYTGGLWDIFPEQEDESLDGMRRQGDLPIYEATAGTPEG